MKLGQFLLSMVSDSKTQSVSTKRMIGIFGFLFLSVAMFINIIWGRNVSPNQDLITAVKDITMASLFASSADKIINSIKLGKSDNVSESTVEIKSKTVEPAE